MNVTFNRNIMNKMIVPSTFMFSFRRVFTITGHLTSTKNNVLIF